jgi:outer membrane protein assembly factor BamE (lipoprotein component of BamABCDE complex)
MRKVFFIFSFALVTCFLAGCISSPQNNIDNKDSLTLGTVQKDIEKGISQSNVVAILGSPNIVTNDENLDTWVYDKISTERFDSKSAASAGGMVVGGSGAGYLGASGSQSSSTTVQKTLTVIIKFDSNNRVENVTYHSSKY